MESLAMIGSHGGRLALRSVAAACCLFVGSHAVAGPLATTAFALNDGFGPAGGAWRGTVNIAGAAFGDTLIAEVDWAAFAPGGLQQYLNSQAIAQVDPSGPGEVSYVYQITSVAAAVPGIDTLTVGLDAADGRGGVSAPAFLPTGAVGEKSPASGGDNGTSMAWFFNGTELTAGDVSSLLVFSSPFSPEFDFVQANSGLAGPVVSPLVASPSNRLFVPEPGSVVLAVGCAVALLAGRRWR
jgi:hypothetical protein